MNNWTPPKSPFDLLQERFWPDEWKILVVCLLLNLTSRKQVEPMIAGFFEKYPDPKSIIAASEEELRPILKPLGLVNKRVKTLKRFSIEFLKKEWKTAKDLYGCGKYADDAWRIFCLGNYAGLEPHDHALVDYHGFLTSDANLRGSSYA
jgi:methyl-CpG-binding domain protein 4